MSTVLEKLVKLDKSEKTLVKNMGALMKKYPNKYVAIADGEVVFANSDLDKLLEAVTTKFGTTHGVLIDYISSKHVPLVV